MSITISQIKAWQPCSEVGDAYLDNLYGDNRSLTALEFYQSSIPTEHKLWVFLRSYFFNKDQLKLLICDFIDHALLVTNGSEKIEMQSYVSKLRTKLDAEDLEAIKFSSLDLVTSSTSRLGRYIARAIHDAASLDEAMSITRVSGFILKKFSNREVEAQWQLDRVLEIYEGAN